MIYEFDYDDQKAAFLLEDLVAVVIDFAKGPLYKTSLKVCLKGGTAISVSFDYGDEGKKSATEIYDFLKDEIQKRNS